MTLQRASRFRCVTSQVLACTISNALFLGLSMAAGFSVIAIPRLLNAKEGLSLNKHQASWFGSTCYLTQPFGAVLSGPLVDYVGRRKANFLVNIPHLIAWTLMYFAWDLPSLFTAMVLLGFGTGIMEAPVNAYVGEISEPKLRGMLCTACQIFMAAGNFIICLLGVIFDWRDAALICLFAPIAGMILSLLVPDTPVWLLDQGREKEALEALCFIRGWTTPDDVKQEFEQLVKYTHNIKGCIICYKTKGVELRSEEGCEHEKIFFIKRLLLQFKYTMFCKETLRPFALVMVYFFSWTVGGIIGIKPNLLNICDAFGMPGNSKVTLVYVAVTASIGAFLQVVLVRLLGKRKMAIPALAGSATCCACLSAYAKWNLPDTVSSYDPSTFPTEKSYFPLVILYVMVACISFGVPWTLLSEVFSFRCRATAQGFAAAGNYVIVFLASKTFIDLDTTLHLSGTFAFYCFAGLIGAVYLYMFLPETEGKALEEIEESYKGELKIFANDPFMNSMRRLRKKFSSRKMGL